MTPPRLAQFLVDSLVRNYPPAARPLRVCEPHAGDGAFVQALRKALPAAHITANDADHMREAADILRTMTATADANSPSYGAKPDIVRLGEWYRRDMEKGTRI
jgi:hypothetical protein